MLKLYKRTIGVLLLGMTIVAFASGFQKGSASDVEPVRGAMVVIVNKDNPISTLDAVQVKLYYLRKVKSRWPSINKNIKPIERKGSPEVKQSFLSKVIKMSAEDVDRYFIEKQYQKATPVPAKAGSDSEVVNYVKNNIGGIGYISKSAVTSDVKVIYSF